jgi:thiamine kinase-like enzyme
VIVHGDLWPNNILWSTSSSSSTAAATADELLALLDWQVAHYGTCSSV